MAGGVVAGRCSCPTSSSCPTSTRRAWARSGTAWMSWPRRVHPGRHLSHRGADGVPLRQGWRLPPWRGPIRQNPDAYFVNVDLIGFIESTPSADYPAPLLQFFADVERDWVAMDGFPHNGKMYGFYDPTQAAGTTHRCLQHELPRRPPQAAWGTFEGIQRLSKVARIRPGCSTTPFCVSCWKVRRQDHVGLRGEPTSIFASTSSRPGAQACLGMIFAGLPEMVASVPCAPGGPSPPFPGLLPPLPLGQPLAPPPPPPSPPAPPGPMAPG